MTSSSILAYAESLYSEISSYMNIIVIALVIVLVGFIVARVVESLLRYVLARSKTDENLTRIFGARRNYARTIRRVTVRCIYILTIILALDRLRLAKLVLIFVVLLAVIVLLASLVLAGLDIVPNLAARTVLRRRNITIGDEVIFTDQNGVIQGMIIDITMTDVLVRRRNGDLFFVPNAAFLNQSVTKKRRSDGN